jgi:PIN domain nuclease of toxin-antitoxin system
MPDLVADTHAVVWYLSEPERLSPSARTAFVEAAETGSRVYLSAISLVEIQYLTEKGGLPPLVGSLLREAIDGPEAPCFVLPVDRAVAEFVARIPRSVVPDMPDRIIAATALALNLPLVTRDAQIHASGIPVIW